ncbi:MAG: Rho termination factor N-terminal domain-containing protein [Proteobacteria bacterium]|nr:Rho termination factor N-terminal domain-containing protein [Pseudomonadota bacterium]
MDKSDLMSKTVKELRTEAERLGVKRLSALKKNELVDAILAALAEQAAPKAADKGDKKVSGKAVKAAEAPKAKKSAAKAEADAKAEDSDKKAAKVEDKVEDKAEGKSAADKAGDADKKAAAKKKPAKKAVKSVKSGKSADKADEAAELEEELEEEAADEETEEVEETEEAEAVEPPPVEPDSVYIDRGAILPEYVPGTCLYALVRDPGTLFVYWNATFESDHGWLLTAYDAAGNELQSFRTPARRNGRGYFRIPTARVARVTLSIVNAGGSSDVKLESRIRIAEQLGIAQPRPAYDERWVDFGSREVVYEAPAPGRAPAFGEVYQSMTGDGMTGGGFDRSVEVQANQGALIPGTSRFGVLGAPGSSDTLVGSSDSIVRRRS